MLSAQRIRSEGGYVFAFASAALFGSIPALAKPAASSVNPLVLAAAVSITAAIFFTPLAARQKIRLTRKGLGLVIAISALGAVAAPSLYFIGLQTTTASDATVLSNSEIMFTVLIAVLVFKERLDKSGYAAVGFVIAGILLITTRFDPAFMALDLQDQGNMLVIATMLCWAADNNLSKIATRIIDVRRLVQLKTAIGGAALVCIAVALGVPIFIPQESLLSTVTLGLVGFAAPMILFYLALKRIGTVRTILVFSTSSVFGIAYAAVFLGESIMPHQVLALGIMVAGLLLLRGSKAATF